MKTIGQFQFTKHALSRFNQRFPNSSIEVEARTAEYIKPERQSQRTSMGRRLLHLSKPMKFLTRGEAVFVCVEAEGYYKVITVILYLKPNENIVDDMVMRIIEKNNKSPFQEGLFDMRLLTNSRLDVLRSCSVYRYLVVQSSALDGYMSDADLFALRKEMDLIKVSEQIEAEETFSLYNQINRKLSPTLNRKPWLMFDIQELRHALGSGCYVFDSQFNHLRRMVISHNFPQYTGISDYESGLLLIKLCAERSVSTIENDRSGFIDSYLSRHIEVTLGSLINHFPDYSDFFRACEVRLVESNLMKRQNVYLELAQKLEDDWALLLPDIEPLVMDKPAGERCEIDKQIQGCRNLSPLIYLLKQWRAQTPSGLLKFVNTLNRERDSGSIDPAMFSFLMTQVYTLVSHTFRVCEPIALPAVYRVLQPTGALLDSSVELLGRTLENLKDAPKVSRYSIESSIHTVTEILDKWELSEAQSNRVRAMERVYRMMLGHCKRTGVRFVCVSELIGC